MTHLTYKEFSSSHAFALKSMPMYFGCSCCSHLLWPDFAISTTGRNVSCLESVVTCSRVSVSLPGHLSQGQHQSECSCSDTFWLVLLKQALAVCLQSIHLRQPARYRFWSSACTFIHIRGNYCSLLLAIQFIFLMKAIPLPACKHHYRWRRTSLY